VTAEPTTLPRFARAERWTHRSIGILTGVLLLTAAALYIPDISARVGNRQLVRVLHEVAGFALPIPLLLALASYAFRQDAGRLNRFAPSDWEWLRSRDRRSGRIRVGKFNAGQKLNAAFTLGAIVVMLMTGALMFFSSHFSDDLRTGATFVHDWLALAVAVVVGGHAYMAFSDATARLGMRTGSVPIEWARREHAAWADELTVYASPPVAAADGVSPATDGEAPERD
jgi:formate dehydrogenase subunit gamma